ncbi:heterokaryon incompatibility protein-domain-containing protein [Lasiosphaeria miniovina]|uniref:Heterokaryon incompatibility protein-domain-containing protein n=1 Tax=Lasiosphaeria miniovina TaxID=1954250 RepID=A0AA40ACC1_9PEZI|nr:heterokaryon incompatibility protein-domain-containing protein [Lasiosphaeria miniovina]KAK0713154.1 heterokaryon incompatibility protein-domain-containing protein [Lasiosphaeria miniovina]
MLSKLTKLLNRGPTDKNSPLRYKYKSLSRGSKREFRLLVLSPAATHHDPLVTQLVTLQFEPDGRGQLPEYEALSYTWGDTATLDADLSESIIVVDDDSRRDWAILPVTRNLAAALQHLRRPNESRVIWADAVCINQADKREKSDQVRRMADIYRSAARVVVWLGPGADNSTYALALLDYLGSKIEVDWGRETMRLSPAEPPGEPIDLETHWADINETLPYKSKELHAICSLLFRPWFERLWIRQEIALAKPEAAIFMCGQDSICWSNFSKSIFCLKIKPKEVHFLGDKAMPFTYRLDLVFNLRRGGKPPGEADNFEMLSILLDQTQNCKCTDSRDKIFALLSLLPKRERLAAGIEPDYTKTAAQVYQDVVVKYARAFGSLDFLPHCELDTTRQAPTWVPDWSKPRKGYLRKEGNATNNVLAHEAKYVGKGILRVCAIRAGVVAKSKVIEGMSLSSEPTDVIAALKRYAPPDVLNAPYVGGGTLLHAYSRVMSMDTAGGDVLEDKMPANLTRESCTRTLKRLLQDEEPSIDVAQGSVDITFLRAVRYWTAGASRSLVTTKTGHIGLAPAAAMPGDEIWVVLGCTVPLLLRSAPPAKGHPQSSYQVVGETSVPGMMFGEELFGPIPDHCWPVKYYEESWGGLIILLFNAETNTATDKDPRLEKLGLNAQVDAVGKNTVSELRAADLRKFGAQVEAINLV